MNNWVIKELKVNGTKTKLADETKPEQNFYLYFWFFPMITSSPASAHTPGMFSAKGMFLRLI